VFLSQKELDREYDGSAMHISLRERLFLPLGYKVQIEMFATDTLIKR